MRQINSRGITLIKRWEGLRLTAYKDIVGVWTIGYGSTGSHVKPGMKITEAEAEALLRKDLSRFEANVEKVVKVKLTDNQFAALVSWSFNVGIGAMNKSTLLKKLNAGNYNAVPTELMKWNKAGGKAVQGLTNRRAQEGALWGKGEFVASNFVNVQAPETSHKDVATIGASGATGIAASVGPALPEITDALINQQLELTSGDWIRICIAVVILGLSIYGIYRRIKNA